jgi:hypothetical protein
VDNIVKAQPSWALHVPLLRYVTVGDVLYHEIGHHIHAVHRPVYDGKENVAEGIVWTVSDSNLPSEALLVFDACSISSCVAVDTGKKNPQVAETQGRSPELRSD